MPNSLMSRNTFPPLLSRGLRHIFVEFTDLTMRSAQYTEFMNVMSSEDAYEIDYHVAGTGPMPEMPEGTRPLYDGLIQSGTKKYLHLPYGLASQVTRQLVEDDKYGIIRQIPKAHARSALYAREAVSASILNLGGTLITTDDGQTLFNTAHALPGGTEATSVGPGVSGLVSASGTYPNRPSPDADFSFTAIQQGINYFYRFTDGRGIPSMLRPKHVWIPPELIMIAREILGSPGKPYTMDNELNALQGEELDFKHLNYLTSPSAWFMSSSKEETGTKFYERVPIQAQTDDDFQTQVLIFLTTQRFSSGASWWQGWYGSYGA
jgi:phage major head subunit gpT-like protein